MFGHIFIVAKTIASTLSGKMCYLRNISVLQIYTNLVTDTAHNFDLIVLKVEFHQSNFRLNQVEMN